MPKTNIIIRVVVILFTLAKGDNSPRNCSEEICIPLDYNNNHRPYDNMNIYFQLTNGKIASSTLRKVDDKEFTISLTLNLMILWYDQRVKTNSTNKEELELPL